ncbi:MAG: response regulator transcription factor [Lachnospiraceae bacterium]|nr:response regulator transcription factor [Lachnospiraceae bacterium]
MKKILLIGELNQTLSSVNRHLSMKFQTQVCVDSFELVKGMTKVFEPEMVVVCLVGVNDLNNKILEFFWKQYPEIPVLLIGTADECGCYQKYYESGQFEYIVRPTTLSKLMKKCLEMLQMIEVEQIVETEPDTSEQERKRILVVDDSGILLRSVKAMLDKKYDISVATDGKLALKQAKKNKPDLILLDYEMPEWDGKKTLEEIRNDAELKDIPVVFLTGVADKEHIIAVLDLKPAGYLLKPIEQQRLIDTIEKVFSGTV